MKVAQALKNSWELSKLEDTPQSKSVPLEYYLQFQYKERYCPLIRRLGAEPLSFANFLFLDVNKFI